MRVKINLYDFRSNKRVKNSVKVSDFPHVIYGKTPNHWTDELLYMYVKMRVIKEILQRKVDCISSFLSFFKLFK